MATGTGNLPYAPTYVSPFDVITSQAENETQDNISSLADGSGIGDGAIDTVQLADGAVTTAKLEDAAVTSAKIDFTTLGFGNYSTSETDTGFTWIDGKSIYKKTINFGALPNNTNKEVNHGITYETIVNTEFMIGNSGGTFATVPFVSDSSSGAASGSIAMTVRTSVVRVSTFADRTAFSGYITIYYTKP